MCRARRKLSVRMQSVPAPPGVVMVSPPEVPCNAQQGKVKAAPNAMGRKTSQRGQEQYRDRSPKAPARLARTVEGLSTCRVLCARLRYQSGGGLRASGRGKAKAVLWEDGHPR